LQNFGRFLRAGEFRRDKDKKADLVRGRVITFGYRGLEGKGRSKLRPTKAVASYRTQELAREMTFGKVDGGFARE
jgi:hypothetical protein